MHYYSESDSLLIDKEVKSIVFQRENNGGRVPRGAFPEAIDHLLQHGIVVTRGVLNTRIKRHLAKMEESRSGINIPTILEWDMDNCSVVSDLTPINFSTTAIEIPPHLYNWYYAKITEIAATTGTSTNSSMSSFSPLVIPEGTVYDPTDGSDSSCDRTRSTTTSGSTTTSNKMLYRKPRTGTVRKHLWIKTYRNHDKKKKNVTTRDRKDSTQVSTTQATEISV